MSWLSRLTHAFRPASLNETLEGELQFHLDAKTAELIAAGMDPQTARETAVRQFGRRLHVREASRDIKSNQWVESFLQDAWYAIRSMRRTPRLAALAVLTLALGVGANSAVFSVVDPLLWRPLPVAEPDRLFHLQTAGTLMTEDIVERAAVAPYAARSDVFEGVLADGGLYEFQSLHRGRQTTVSGEMVSPNFFSLLGISAQAGRLELGSTSIVLGHPFWTSAFNGDATVIGDALVINGKSYVVAGIAPAGFFGITVGASPDFYASFESGLESRLRNADWVTAIGRLRVGVSASQAVTALGPTFREIVRNSSVPAIEKEQDMARLILSPAGRGLTDLRASFGTRAWILMAVVVLVLLVASANVANLLLTRAAQRQQEVAIQLALGAAPGRLARQFIVEGAIIALLGTLGGVASARWTSQALVSALSVGRAQITLATTIDGRVLAFTAAVLCVTVILCAVVPAFTSVRNVARGLALRSAGLDRGARPSLLRRSLVVAQIAASVTLLSGSGLLLRSLVNLYSFDVGFNPERVLTVSMDDGRVNRPVGQAEATLTRVVDQASQLPGVARAAMASQSPLTSRQVGINLLADVGPGAPVHALFATVTPGYFETVGVRIVEGRGCQPADTLASTQTAIVNQRLARHLFNDTSPLDHQMRFVEGRRQQIAIVGVAADGIYNAIREDPLDFFYLCRRQAQAPLRGVLFVRASDGHAVDLAPSVERLVRSIDPDVRLVDVKTLGDYRNDSLATDRLATQLFSGFTIVALLIAAVGLYGVMAAMVTRQTPEIGLRMALGADTHRILRFVFGPAARMTLAGLVLGLGGAVAASSLLTSLLFELQATDPLTYAGVAIALGVTVAVACYIPARRATRVDPLKALRSE